LLLFFLSLLYSFFLTFFISLFCLAFSISFFIFFLYPSSFLIFSLLLTFLSFIFLRFSLSPLYIYTFLSRSFLIFLSFFRYFFCPSVCNQPKAVVNIPLRTGKRSIPSHSARASFSYKATGRQWVWSSHGTLQSLEIEHSRRTVVEVNKKTDGDSLEAV
jgi:hypothetical protein